MYTHKYNSHPFIKKSRGQKRAWAKIVIFITHAAKKLLCDVIKIKTQIVEIAGTNFPVDVTHSKYIIKLFIQLYSICCLFYLYNRVFYIPFAVFIYLMCVRFRKQITDYIYYRKFDLYFFFFASQDNRFLSMNFTSTRWACYLLHTAIY